MATIPKKTPTAGAGDRSSASNGATSPSPAGRRGTGAAPSTPSNGIARARSVRTAATTASANASRMAVKKSVGASELKKSRTPSEEEEEDAHRESAGLVEELKARVQRAEEASEEYKKQIEVLQARLDEAVSEQGKLEDKLHEEEERIEGVDNEKRELLRQKRELEAIYEAERVAAMKERESSQAREEEMQVVIQRLKESLSQREEGRLSRTASSPTLETGFAPSSQLQRSNSRNNSKLILQKDQLIESLRLELAEVQIKVMEMENMSDASRKVQELERTLLDQRVTNARLMEDIDSYQLLLSERTLNGDFSRNDLLRSSPAPGDGPHTEQPTSLADELSSFAGSEEGDPTSDHAEVKRLQGEVQTMKDSNKALTLYINKIIERVLQHQGGYENILSNADDDAPPGAQRPPPPPPPKTDKDLPPPPPEKEAPGPSFLQRASSVVYGKGDKPKPPRPQSAAIQPRVTEDLATAPSIPLNRTASKRMTVDLSSRRRSTQIDQHAATIVGNMYRGPSGDVVSPASPSIVSPRNSFFAYRQPSGNAPTVSSIREDADLDSTSDDDVSAANRRSALDALNGSEGSPSKASTRSPSRNRDSSTTNTTLSDGVHVDTPSPPRNMASREREEGRVMGGNKMRPLRLVKEAEDEQKKTNNRASWAVPANIAQGISGWWNKEGQNKEGQNKEGGGGGGGTKQDGAGAGSGA